METGDTIEVFQDVSFTDTQHGTATLRNALKARTVAPWFPDPEWEEIACSSDNPKRDVIAFKRDAYRKIGPTRLCLFTKDQSDWSIPNVMPVEFHVRLSISQYNDIVENFVDYILNPALKPLGITPLISPRRLNLYATISKESARSLSAFLTSDSLRSSALFPKDEQRLCDFIWTLSQHDEDFDATFLERWLHEVKLWPEDRAEAIAARVHHGLTLLKSRPAS